MRIKTYWVSLPLFMFFCGCESIYTNTDCDGDTGNYKKDIDFGDYYYFREYNINTEKIYDSQENKYFYHSNSVFFKEHLNLRKDSSFYYDATWVHYVDSNKNDLIIDTMEYMSGIFHIRPNKKEKWHSFILESDSIFTRWDILQEKKYEWHLVIDEEYQSLPYSANGDTILLNVDTKDSCFTLSEWHQDATDITFACQDSYIKKSRIFCANKSIKDSSIVDVITK